MSLRKQQLLENHILERTSLLSVCFSLESCDIHLLKSLFECVSLSSNVHACCIYDLGQYWSFQTIKKTLQGAEILWLPD